MASSFPTSVDVLPDHGSTLASPGREHSLLHTKLRDGLSAVQAFALAQITAIKANGWVTTARIADRAVTDAKIATVAAAKLTGTITNAISSAGSVIAAGNVQAGAFLRAGTAAHDPAFKIQRLGGTLDTSGGASVAHNIGVAHLRVLDVAVFVKGDTSEARKISNTEYVIDGAFLTISGTGAGNAAWRGHILYTEDTPAW